ncbi:aromatic-ring-hydroxylating dioxygenase subunit beta [Pigmentiphaga soli]|uniref:Aromatic-ring-hydroxylating dioxygenase subunit beta n=1 Tax=Pigmentiphaga soli TaxID=1007095 RepID=A0ABP8H768_9BURK
MSALLAGRPAFDRDTLADFLTAYCDSLDDGHFDEWPSFFTDDARYSVTTAENRSKGYPAGMIDCIGKPMMRDRIYALTSANVFEPHTYRHVLSLPRVLGREPGGLRVKTAFMVMRTMAARQSEPFLCGYYDDLLVDDGGPRLKSRTVVCDASLIDMLIVIPL